jgi:uncharacterized protein with HEPN domain
MTSNEVLKLLTDIINSIHSIDEHLEGKRILEEYLNNKTKRRAVERELEIIGEAMSKLLKLDPKIPLSYARLIVDLRNKVIHAYDTIDDIIVWKIITKDIPVLLTEADDLLKSGRTKQ